MVESPWLASFAGSSFAAGSAATARRIDARPRQPPAAGALSNIHRRGAARDGDCDAVCYWRLALVVLCFEIRHGSGFCSWCVTSWVFLHPDFVALDVLAQFFDSGRRHRWPAAGPSTR